METVYIHTQQNGTDTTKRISKQTTIPSKTLSVTIRDLFHINGSIYCTVIILYLQKVQCSTECTLSLSYVYTYKLTNLSKS